MNGLEHAKNVINTVAASERKVILFFSGGKDSLVLLDLLAQRFDKVYCVFMYLVEGLEHQEMYLRWAEARYGDRIEVIRVPDFSLTTIFRLGEYCNPRPELQQLTLDDICKHVRGKVGDHWITMGMKMADSARRRLFLQVLPMNAISASTRKFYPLTMLKNKDMYAYIKQHNIPAPCSYGVSKASYGFCFQPYVFQYLKQHYPNDLKKVIAAFPMSEVILYKKVEDGKNKVPKDGDGNTKKKRDKPRSVQPPKDKATGRGKSAPKP